MMDINGEWLSLAIAQKVFFFRRVYQVESSSTVLDTAHIGLWESSLLQFTGTQNKELSHLQILKKVHFQIQRPPNLKIKNPKFQTI
jgi:hypothetical protein